MRPPLPMELIVSHSNADFDSLAAMAAAKKLYPDAELAFCGSADGGVREFLSIHGEWLRVHSASEIDLKRVKRLIVVDTREAIRLGDFREIVERPDVEVHVYDHHPTSYRDIVGEFNLVKPVGSTTTLLVSLIRERKIPITPQEATLFCTGIYVDTGSLSFPTTTPEDLKAAAWLIEKGASLRIVGDYLNRSLSLEQRRLLNKLVLSAKLVQIHGHDVLLTRGETEHYVDELAILTHRILDLEKVPAVFSIVRMGDRVFVVGRSGTPAIDVGEITQELGGGGHPTAASASLKGDDLEKIEQQLSKILQRKIRPTLTAADVMSTPVWKITPQKSIQEAQREMSRFGAKIFLVMEDGILHGVLSRRDVDKAINHGYGHAPVSAYMSRQLVVTTPNTPLAEVQRIMVSHDIGRVPVVKAGEVVGMVTREGILKGMRLQEFEKPLLAGTLRIEDWTALPGFLLDWIRLAGETASAMNVNVFAVGGFVRDFLLSVKNFDLDLVVEGDGISFAKIFGEKLGGRVRSHEKFGTAVIVLSDGRKIDVAGARAEYYARPAALPEVVGTSIKQDLFRRDFSINAMAIKLNPSEFGKLIDFFGGQRDLQHGVVRVLHNLSFVDDPTRIFRAIRFEQRYHFRMDSHTEKLLKEAVSSGVVSHLSMERVRDELLLLLSESDPLPAIRRMARLKVLPLIHSLFTLSSSTIQIMERIPETLAHFHALVEEEKVETWLIYGIALFSELGTEDLEEAISRLRWTKSEREKFSVLGHDWQKTVHDLGFGKDLHPSEVVRRLENFSVEGILFLMAFSRNAAAQKHLREYLLHFRKIEPILTGQDLQNLGMLPGPAYREWLEKVKERQLDGKIRTKEEALNFLKEEMEKTCQNAG